MVKRRVADTATHITATITSASNKNNNPAPSPTPSVTTLNPDTNGTPSPCPLTMLLPLKATLPDGKDVTVSVVCDHQVTDVYDMIQEAALNGDGYGVDEFPTKDHFLTEIRNENGKMFHICLSNSHQSSVPPSCENSSSSTITSTSSASSSSPQSSSTTSTSLPLAAFIILDSKYYRGQGTVADSYIVVRRAERRKGLGEFCMRMIMELASRLGYLGIYSDTFHDNIAMRKIIEQSGFQKVGFLPMSARMPDGSVKPSVIYYRDLQMSSSSGTDARAGDSHQSHMEDRSSPNLQDLDHIHHPCAESETTPS